MFTCTINLLPIFFVAVLNPFDSYSSLEFLIFYYSIIIEARCEIKTN